MICERCTYGTGVHICLRWGASRREPKVLKGYDIHAVRLARYADELVQITQELRDTADMIAGIESEPSRIGELMGSRDWRADEIKDLHRHVADLRARIGAY